MSETLAVLETAPAGGGRGRLARAPGADVVALTPEVSAECAGAGIEATFPDALREDRLVYPADERAIRWASEFMAAVRGDGDPLLHRAIELGLMLEGRLRFYFFRRLALFYTKLEAEIGNVRPRRLVLSTNDPVFQALARSIADRRGLAFETLRARPAPGLGDREGLRRRHGTRYGALVAYDLWQALHPLTPPRIDAPDGVLALFAESYRHMELTEPVFRALASRGRFGVVVCHRRGPMSRPVGLDARYAPLDRYLSLDGFSSMLGAVRRESVRLPSPSRIAARAPEAEWRDIAAAARRELLYGALVFTVGLIERVRRVVEAHHPDVGIMLTEMGAFGQTIARAGRRFGMATLNMEHGLKTHLPMVEKVVTDRIAAFGERSAEILVRQGADPKSIVLTGAPRYDPLFRREGLPARAETLARLGIAADARLVVFASYPLGISATHSEAHKEAIVRALAAAVESIPGGALAVKRHPLEDDAVATRVLAGKAPDRFRVFADREAPLYPLLDACDVLVTFTSTTALEAVILGKPILIVNLSGTQDTTPFVREGIALYADTPGAVAPALGRLLEDDGLRAELAAARARFIRCYATSDDGRAAERVADLIVEMIAEKRGRK